MSDWRSRRGPNQDTGSDGAGKTEKKVLLLLILCTRRISGHNYEKFKHKTQETNKSDHGTSGTPATVEEEGAMSLF